MRIKKEIKLVLKKSYFIGNDRNDLSINNEKISFTDLSNVKFNKLFLENKIINRPECILKY